MPCNVNLACAKEPPEALSGRSSLPTQQFRNKGSTGTGGKSGIQTPAAAVTLLMGAGASSSGIAVWACVHLLSALHR